MAMLGGRVAGPAPGLHRPLHLARAPRPCQTKPRPRQRVALIRPPSAASICFDEACQAAKDQAFVLATLLPSVAAVALAFVLARKTKAGEAEGEGDDDSSSGRRSDSVGGEAAGPGPSASAEEFERDKLGNPVVALDGWMTFPVPVGSEEAGSRLKVEVGPMGRRTKRLFFFGHQPARTRLFTTTLDLPLGLRFGQDPRSKAIVIEEILEGTDAARQRQVARLSGQLAIAPGDTLVAFSSINFFYGGQAIFGMKPPQRTRVMYGCRGLGGAGRNRGLEECLTALARTQVADGPVTLVLERPITQEDATNAQ